MSSIKIVKREEIMLSIFIKINEEYFVWDNQFKCPTTSGMNEIDLFYWISEQEKQDGIDSFQERLKRAKETGVSQIGINIDDFIKGNAAGEGGKELSKEEIYENYNYLVEFNPKVLYPGKPAEKQKKIKNTVLQKINDKWYIANGVIISFMIFAILTVFIFYVTEHKELLNIKDNSMILHYCLMLKPYLLNIDVFIIGIVMASKMTIWKKK